MSKRNLTPEMRDENGKIEEALDDAIETFGVALSTRFADCDTTKVQAETVRALRVSLWEYAKGALHAN